MTKPRVHVWRAPLVIAVASSAGLVSALVGDGVWDALSWLGLGAPVAMSLLFLARAKRR